MAPSYLSKRSTPILGCGFAIGTFFAMVVAFVVIVIGGGVVVASCVLRERKFLLSEHAVWPKATPLGSFHSKSPGGAFTTTARKHGGDGLSTHSEKHDCIFIESVGCPDSAVEFTAQDHAMCETSWWGCKRSDGGLLHERFGVKLRWLDAKRIKVSWTELTGLDTSGHRVWGQRSEVLRVNATKNAPGAKCGDIDLTAE